MRINWYRFIGDERWRNPFNVFMSLNVPLSEVYLTKGQCADGACVLEDFVVATGKLSAGTPYGGGDYTLGERITIGVRLASGWDVRNWDDALSNLDAPSEDTTYTVNVMEVIGGVVEEGRHAGVLVGACRGGERRNPMQNQYTFNSVSIVFQ